MFKHTRKSASRITPFSVYRDGQFRTINLTGLFNGRAAFLTSSGPSLKSMNLDLLRQPGILRIGVNNSPSIIRPHIWVSVDEPAKFLESIWRDPTILKFVSKSQANDIICRRLRSVWEYYGPRVQECPAVIFSERNNTFRADKFFDEPTINGGNEKWYGGARSVMIVMTRIAYEIGIRRLYLCGCDFTMTETRRYAFDEKSWAGTVRGNTSTYRQMVSYFTQISFQFKARDFQIFNCTPQSGLKLFPYLPLEEAVKRELADFPDPSKEKTWGRYLNNDASKISEADKQKWREVHEPETLPVP